MVWQPATRRQMYRIAAVALVLAIAGTGLLVATSAPTSADMTVESLDVANHSETLDQNVSDVVLSTTLAYEHDVPDADRRLVKLKVGPSRDNLEMVGYRQTRDPAGQASGTVQIDGNLVADGPFEASDFNAPVAGNTSQQIVVQAVVEIQRTNGESVTHTATDTATLTITDATELHVTIGGEGELDVVTES